MIPRVDELAEPAVVGRYYLVPSVLAFNVYGSLAPEWWPIWPEAHSDPELIDCAGDHYHFDQRFLYRRQWDRFSGDASYRYVLWRWRQAGNAAIIARGPELRRRRCLRQFAYPSRGSVVIEPKLSKFHRRLAACRRCPHRGFDLRQVPPDAAGVITCPGHGLRFHAATGAPAPIALGKVLA